MRHPAEGTLRRLVDEPAGVADPDRAHVAACRACLTALAEVQRDAALAASALDTAPATDVDAGWHRLSRTVAADPGRRPATHRASRWRAWLRSPVAAGLGAAALLAGAGAAAANDWLPIFRTERVAPVPVADLDLVALPDLAAYGRVDVVEEPDVRMVPGPDAARAATGLAVPRPARLPRALGNDPRYLAGGRAVAVFTFSAEQAARTAAAAGEALPPPPPGLDGARFRLEAGPGVAAVWDSRSGVPALVVARGVAPSASSSGVPFATARDYLLSLPGLPPGVAEQLRGFGGDPATLPLPFPAELATSRPADVRGVPASVLTSRDGAFAGVVWVADGVVNAVAGSFDDDEVLAVARGLRFA